MSAENELREEFIRGIASTEPSLADVGDFEDQLSPRTGSNYAEDILGYASQLESADERIRRQRSADRKVKHTPTQVWGGHPNVRRKVEIRNRKLDVLYRGDSPLQDGVAGDIIFGFDGGGQLLDQPGKIQTAQPTAHIEGQGGLPFASLLRL